MKNYKVYVREGIAVLTADISKENIERIEKEWRCNVLSIQEDSRDYSIKSEPTSEPKSDDNSRCMSDSNGSRMFQTGLNRFGY